jgi:hypothetical protein
MKKLFNKKTVGAILVVMLALVLLLPVSVNANRSTPCLFYGVVLIDGENAPAESTLTARIEQAEWSTNVYFSNNVSRYNILIPLDKDPVGRNGGNNGDKVYFSLTVNGTTYENKTPSIWKLGTDIIRNLTFHASVPNNLVIETTSLPDGVVGIQYSETGLIASGGKEPYTWKHSNLPAGLDLSEDGVISGTPTIAGNPEVNFILTDSSVPQQSKEKPINVRIWDMGDADHNGVIDSSDVKAAVKMYLGMEAYTLSADINQDGKIDMVDAVLIRNLIP